MGFSAFPQCILHPRKLHGIHQGTELECVTTDPPEYVCGWNADRLLDSVLQIFGHAMLNSVRQARGAAELQRDRDAGDPGPGTGQPAGGAPTDPRGGDALPPAALQKAKRLAGDILQLSQSEVDDLIHPADSDQSALSVSFFSPLTD